MNSVIGFFARKTVSLAYRASILLSMVNAFSPNSSNSSTGIDQPVEESLLVPVTLCFISLMGIVGISYTCYNECNKKTQKDPQHEEKPNQKIQRDPQPEENPNQSDNAVQNKAPPKLQNEPESLKTPLLGVV